MNMRWKKFVGGLALSLTAVTGCKQPVFMTEGDFQGTLTAAQLPSGLETDPDAGSIKPDLTNKITPKPTDVFDPDRPPRYLSLTEALARALENGTVGQFGTGQSNDTSVSNVNQTIARGLGFGAIDRDSIRVLALDPANVYTDVEASLSKFDTHWVSSMSWNTTDRPVGTALDVIQSAGTVNTIRTQAAELTSSFIKPLPTGGVAAITFDNQYQITNLPTRAGLNPTYTPSVQFQFEQPLLQGFGVDINQIRTDHPGSILSGTQFQTQPRNAQEGIVLTRIRFDQTRAIFEATVQEMLLNVEIAYWNLYSAYGQLYANEIALRKNLEVWRLTKDRVEAGIKQFTQADVYESQGQYESSRSAWLASLGQVLESERNLRGLMGMKPADKERLVPSDAPTLAPYRPDWESSLQEALVMKPELVVEREQIKATQLHLIDLKNRLLPDVRFTSTYNVNGLGNRLDGADPTSNAFRDMASDHFNSWSTGLRADIQLGYRDANAGMRLGRLQLAQAYWALRTGEDKVTRYLAQQYRHVSEFQEQIEMNQAAMEAYNNELIVRIQRIRAGSDTPDVTLQAIRFGSAAMVQYYQFLGQYNSALANFEFAKGTLLRRDNVMIAEGPLPGCPQIRAVEHEEARTKALILHEREGPMSGGHEPSSDSLSVIGQAFNPDTLSLPDWIRSHPSGQPEGMTPSSALPTPASNPWMGNSQPAALPTPASNPWMGNSQPAPHSLDQIGPGMVGMSPAVPSPAATLPASVPAPVVLKPASVPAPVVLKPASVPAPVVLKPAIAPAPAAPSTGYGGSYGTLRSLNFPEDRPASATLPALPGADAGNSPR
jgi:outer membrane protein TolC